MNDVLKPIDVNQLFRDVKSVNQCIESFELNWVEKKDLVDTTPPHIQIMTVGVKPILVPVIKIKYYDNE